MAAFMKTPAVQQPKAISMPDPDDPLLLAKKRQAALANLAEGGSRQANILSGGGGSGDYNGTVLGN